MGAENPNALPHSTLCAAPRTFFDQTGVVPYVDLAYASIFPADARHWHPRPLWLLALGDRAKANRHIEGTPEASPQATPASGPSLLLRMESSGGLMPMEYVAVQMPEFSLYDDGSLYRLGPTIAIYPPAALPNLTRMRLSQEGIDAIMEQAKAAGLEHSQSVTNTMVMDAPTTVFTFNDNGTMVKTTAGPLIPDAPIPPDWDEQDTTTYNNLLDLKAFLSGIDASLPEGSVLEPDVPIDPERLQIVSFVPDPAQPLASNVPDLEQPPCRVADLHSACGFRRSLSQDHGRGNTAHVLRRAFG